MIRIRSLLALAAAALAVPALAQDNPAASHEDLLKRVEEVRAEENRLFEQPVAPLEAFRIGNGLRVLAGCVCRSFANTVELVLSRSGFAIDLGLRRERFLKLSAGRCGEGRGNERHHEVEPPSASSFSYFGF